MERKLPLRANRDGRPHQRHLRKESLLRLIKYFIVFESDGDKMVKKMAAYHQYHAVNKAVSAP